MNGAEASRGVLRIAAAGLMLAKSVPALFAAPAAGLALPLVMTALALLVLVGFATRVVGWLAALFMAFVYATFHAPAALSPVDNGGVPAILSACIFAHVAIAGPGLFSVDGWRRPAPARGKAI